MSDSVTSNGKKTASKKARPGSEPTAAQQRARREYLKMAGHKSDPEAVEKIRAQWQQGDIENRGR